MNRYFPKACVLVAAESVSARARSYKRDFKAGVIAAKIENHMEVTKEENAFLVEYVVDQIMSEKFAKFIDAKKATS